MDIVKTAAAAKLRTPWRAREYTHVARVLNAQVLIFVSCQSRHDGPVL